MTEIVYERCAGCNGIRPAWLLESLEDEQELQCMACGTVYMHRIRQRKGTWGDSY